LRSTRAANTSSGGNTVGIDITFRKWLTVKLDTSFNPANTARRLVERRLRRYVNRPWSNVSLSLRNVLARIRRRGDLWEPSFQSRARFNLSQYVSS